MTHTPHELHEEFPSAGEAIRRLKMEDLHFAKLSERYHEVNRAIHRIAVEVEHSSDQYLEDLKKRRLALLDEIGSLIQAAR